MPKRVIVLAASGLFAITCRLQPPDAQVREDQGASSVRTLRSGKEINVLSMEEVMLQKMGRTLVLEYVTDLNIQDHRALQTEVEEIWDNARVDAEKTDVEAVLIIPNEATGGGSVSFALRRNEDGSWRKSGGFIYPEPKAISGLSPRT